MATKKIAGISLFLTMMLGGFLNHILAQDLSVGYDMFSHKKPAYVTKTDGTQIEGTIDKIKRNKGLLTLVVLEVRNKKIELNPEEIDHMYLAPSGLDKLNNDLDQAYTVAKWDREDVESDKIKEGYAYFENANVNLKGKVRPLLMQLLNPGFSSKLRVYFDPFAQETTRVGFAGITVAGGLDKSYYEQRPGEEAYRLKKKEYKKDFVTFYSDCPEVLKEYGKPDWEDFPKHVFYYSKNCK